jgi:hypothetical protein
MAPMTDDCRDLAEEILSSARDRRDMIAHMQSGVAELAARTHRALSDCATQRQIAAGNLHRAASDLRRALRDGDRARRSTFRQTHRRTAARVAELAGGTRQFLRNCNNTRSAVGHEMHRAADASRQRLTHGNSERMEASFRMHREVARRVAGITGDIRRKLDESRRDCLGARAIWKQLASDRS